MAHSGTAAGMSETPGADTGTGADDQPVEPLRQPVAGGDEGGEPAQGSGEPDSH